MHRLLEVVDLVLHLGPVTLEYAGVVPYDVSDSLYIEMPGQTLCYEGGVGGVQGDAENTSQH